MTHILQVTSVTLNTLERQPPHLSVTAEGNFSTGGWTNPRLRIRSQDTPPEDGILDVDFQGDAPDGFVTQALEPVTVTSDPFEQPDWLKGVRVHTQLNAIVAML